MIQAVTRQALTDPAYVRRRPDRPPRWPVSPSTLALPIISTPVLYSSYLNVAFTWTKHTLSAENFQKAMLFRKSGSAV